MQLKTRTRSDGTIARHPPFTDFPVGLWIASFLFDLVSLQLGNPLVRVAFYNIVLGCLFALAAVVTGLLDYNRLPDRHGARKIGMVHALLNTVGFTLFVVNAIWRYGHLDAEHTPVGMVVLSAVAVSVVSVSGWLGGKMAFELGANVRGRAFDAGSLPPERVRV